MPDKLSVKRSPPKRFKNEQTVSYTSFSTPFPQRLNSTAMVSPISNIDFIVFASIGLTSWYIHFYSIIKLYHSFQGYSILSYIYTLFCLVLALFIPSTQLHKITIVSKFTWIYVRHPSDLPKRPFPSNLPIRNPTLPLSPPGSFRPAG